MKSPDFANSSRLLDMKIQSNQRSMTLPEKKNFIRFRVPNSNNVRNTFFSNL